MCGTSLGTYIGRYKNFRLSENGEYAVADLHVDEVCKKSPSGNLYDYVFEMAETNPDMFGNSIVFKGGLLKDEDGEIVEHENGMPYDVCESLLASDLVDEPAATDSLFQKDTFANTVTNFLNTNPKILQLCVDNPSVVETFIKKYAASAGVDTSVAGRLKRAFEKINLLKSEKVEKEDTSEKDDKITELNTSLKGAKDKVSSLEAENKELADENATMKEQLTKLESEINKLSASGVVFKKKKADPELELSTENHLSDEEKALRDEAKKIAKRKK
jgi:hypothetical protein